MTGTQKQVFEKEKTRRDKLSAFVYDLAKLVFAGTFVVNIPNLMAMDFSFQAILNAAFGLITTTILAWIANRILTY